MRVLAIDPGTEQSAFVEYCCDEGKVLHGAIVPNEELLTVTKGVSRWPGQTRVEHLAMEMVASYGMPVGEETFETVLWIGRFIEAFAGPHTKVYRARRGECDSVKMHLCKSNRAKDSNIRQALLDRFPATGGGKCPQVGTKSKPGPLYGFRADMWQALAVAVTWAETHRGPGGAG